MKNKYVCLFVCSLLLCGCSVFRMSTRFTDDKVLPGMNRQEFVAKFGQPFNRSFFIDEYDVLHETLFYKEEIHSGAWFVVTTAFVFEDSRLIAQDVVREERTFTEKDCPDKK